jgi:hypothetical protein
MKRFAALAALAAVAALSASASGSEQRQATLQAAFTPDSAGSAAAVDLHFTWADPGEPNAKPQAVKKLRIAFPAGTQIDTAGMPRCLATDKQVKAKGTRVCPRNTRLGGGKSIATTGTLQIHADVVLINARRQIIVVVIVAKQVFAVYRDTVTRSTVTVNFALPAVISLLDLHVRIPVHQTGKRVYLRTPAECPAAGSWSMTATSSYADGSMQTAPAPVACSP